MTNSKQTNSTFNKEKAFDVLKKGISKYLQDKMDTTKLLTDVTFLSNLISNHYSPFIKDLAFNTKKFNSKTNQEEQVSVNPGGRIHVNFYKNKENGELKVFVQPIYRINNVNSFDESQNIEKLYRVTLNDEQRVELFSEIRPTILATDATGRKVFLKQDKETNRVLGRYQDKVSLNYIPENYMKTELSYVDRKQLHEGRYIKINISDYEYKNKNGENKIISGQIKLQYDPVLNSVMVQSFISQEKLLELKSKVSLQLQKKK